MRAVALAFAAAMLFTTGCSHLRGNPAWMPEYKVHRDVFSNGLTVLFVEDHSVPVVSYTTWFKVGSAWERPGSTGIAHLFEHMMFKGTPRFGAKEFFNRLESKGALVNAYTQRDATVYYEVIASQHLETVIDMESDRMANLKFDQADLDSERQIVKEERRLRVDSNFAAQQMETLEKLAFSHHPYGWPVIGYQEDLDRLTLQQCREFFANYYQPGNAVITIAGDFDYEQAKGLIRKYYGPIRGAPIAQLTLADEKQPGRELRQEIRRPVEAESLMMGYYIPSMYDADADKLSMLAWSVFGITSSRANIRLVREKQLVMGVGAEAQLERFPFLFLITAEMRTGQTAAAAEAEIDRLIEETKAAPLSVEELERVKNKIIYSTINEAKSPAGVASWMANGEFFWGNYRHVYKMIEAFHSMTPRNLMEMARKYLRKENRVVVVMKPEGGKP